MEQTLDPFERIYFKALALESLGELEFDSSSYTIYFDTHYYSMYSVLSCFNMISDIILYKLPIPQWWYEINKSVESVSLYEFIADDGNDITVREFIRKLVHLNKRIHYYLGTIPEGEFDNYMQLINRRMTTVLTSTENALDVLLL